MKDAETRQVKKKKKKTLLLPGEREGPAVSAELIEARRGRERINSFRREWEVHSERGVARTHKGAAFFTSLPSNSAPAASLL